MIKIGFLHLTLLLTMEDVNHSNEYDVYSIPSQY